MSIQGDVTLPEPDAEYREAGLLQTSPFVRGKNQLGGIKHQRDAPGGHYRRRTPREGASPYTTYDATVILSNTIKWPTVE